VVGQTSPPVLFNNPSVIYTYPNTTATLVLPVALGTVGTGKLTVQLVSNGFAQTGGPCNIAVAYMNIDVTVF
jgi:hypothetical protein